MRAPMIAASVLMVLLSVERALADEPLLLVVVEAAPAAAAEIRARIARTLSRPVVSLLDESAPRATESISVALSTDGRTARLCYRTRHGVQFRDATAPANDRQPSWVAQPAAELVQAARRASWASLPQEILDPFADSATPPSPIPSEVIDPWERHQAERPPEPASLLGRPRPR